MSADAKRSVTCTFLGPFHNYLHSASGVKGLLRVLLLQWQLYSIGNLVYFYDTYKQMLYFYFLYLGAFLFVHNIETLIFVCQEGSEILNYSHLHSDKITPF